MSESPGEVVEQRGLWFEELRTGVRLQALARPDDQRGGQHAVLHADHEPAVAAPRRGVQREQTEFGERLVNSLLTMSVLVGLSVGHLTQGTIVANLGFRDARFPHPSGTATRSTARRS